jgi:ubiquinone/menaquinone biosynthesis C-methylase UbiE
MQMHPPQDIRKTARFYLHEECHEVGRRQWAMLGSLDWVSSQLHISSVVLKCPPDLHLTFPTLLGRLFSLERNHQTTLSIFSGKMSKIAQPTATDVGTMYDNQTNLMTEIMAGFIHVGYWENPEHPIESVDLATQRMTLEVINRLRPSSGQHILDVGCGTGKTAASIVTTHEVSVTGITVSNHQVELARKTYQALVEKGKLGFQYADAMQLPLADASFDGAYAIESLVHMNDRRAALRNIARVLRPGSRFSIADLVLDEDCPNPEAIANWHELFQVPALPSANELKELLTETGFNVLDCVDIRQHIRPICGIMDKKGLEVGGDTGETLKEFAASLHGLKELGYILLVAERA